MIATFGCVVALIFGGLAIMSGCTKETVYVLSATICGISLVIAMAAEKILKKIDKIKG